MPQISYFSKGTLKTYVQSVLLFLLPCLDLIMQLKIIIYKRIYRIAGYFRNRNLCTSSKIWIFENLNFKNFIFQSSSGFQNYREIRIANYKCLCLPRTYLLIIMAYEGLLTTICWQSLISGNPALIRGNLDKKKWHYHGPDWSWVNQLLIILHNC